MTLGTAAGSSWRVQPGSQGRGGVSAQQQRQEEAFPEFPSEDTDSEGEFATGFESIYDLAQTLLSFFQGPSLAIIILGVLWKRATGTGALVGLIGGVSFSALLMWVHSNASIPLFQISEPFLYVALWSFILSIILTVIVSIYTKQEPDQK